MKRIFIPAVFAAVSFLVATCAAKKTAVVTKPTSGSSLLESAKLIDPNATQTMLDMGKQTLNTSCARCHAAKDPLKFSSLEWKRDMENMIVKAKMTEEQAAPLRLYTAALQKQAGK